MTQDVMDSFKNKSVLVTGAGGFIGSHLTERLVQEGASVRAMVHYNALNSAGWLGSSPLRDQIEIFAGDICDRDSVMQAMDSVECVFHLAALIAIPYSYQAPQSYIRTNIEGTANVMQAARELKPGCVVHTSTSEVYGTARQVPISENHLLQGQSPYSASKIGADKIAESFHCSFDVPVVTIRPFNTFGPRQSARAVIPTIISQCLREVDCVRLGSLLPTRDMNYVANTVDGYLRAAATPDAIGETINLGSGSEISIGDLAKLISQKTGFKGEIVSDEKRLRPDTSEVERLLADNTKARGLLGWQPEIDLDEGLDKTIAWLRENKKFYNPEQYTV